jgi:aminomethyltransferase
MRVLARRCSQRTALFGVQRDRLKGKMVSFAGYEMPVQFKGVLDEHGACRNKAAVFDVSHMGQLRL